MTEQQKPEDDAPTNHNEFVTWFMTKNRGIITRYIKRHMIPNRYHEDDIRSYMQERILEILKKREQKNKPIEEPKVYFRKLLGYWCIEYQRMHGYCYGLPKRPRKPEDEQEIAKYGFVYFDTLEDNEGSSSDIVNELGYIDTNIVSEEIKEMNFREINVEPDEFTDAWTNIISMALPEDREVLTCIFRYNLTVPQASAELDIAVSTAYQRKERGLKAISGTLASFIDLDQIPWKVINEASRLLKEDVEIDQFLKKKKK